MISNLSKESWDGKVIELGGSILQSWAWGEFMESVGQKVHRFSGDDFMNLAVEFEMPMGKKYLYCPRGPLGNAKVALVDLEKLKSDSTFIFTRVEPATKVDLPRAVKDIQPVNNWVLDLEKPEEQLLAEMKPKTRYNLGLAQRKGVVVREGQQKDLIDLWQLFLETAKRNDFNLHPQSYYFKMWDALSPKYLKILIAEYQGKPLAGMILTIFGETATYAHGGTGPAMREAMAPYTLHWEAIRLAKKLNVKYYDFGGVAPSDENRHAWAGISRFKKSFGGMEVVYPGAFDLIYSPIWYNIYKQGRKLTKLIPKSNAV